jgi:hypothetical protein
MARVRAGKGEKVRTIWKFPLAVTTRQTIEIPLPAKPLAVQPQGADRVCLWAEVDPASEKCEVTILIFGTGHQLPEPLDLGPEEYLRHLDTFQLHGGALVFHAYELVRRIN